MRLDAVVYTVAGMAFGVILGWVIGSQQLGRTASVPAAAPVQQSAAPASGQAGGRQAPPLDQARVDQLTATVNNDPKNTTAVVQLANVYFDAERFTDAVHWYEEAVKINPRDVNASTDLGISYYYTNQPDRALAQFDHSLAIDPKHSKTLLNVGIVRAFGKQDLEGAAKAFQQVLDVAPGSAEARAARQALDGIRSAHPDLPGGAAKQPGAPN